jgi:hypothetical protein
MGIIICDVDNCIANDMLRINEIDWKTEDKFERYHRYHMLSIGDQLRNRHLIEDKRVVFMTAMPQCYSMLRLAWFMKNGFAKPDILFRPNEDDRPSAQVKRDLTLRLLRTRKISPAEIEIVYDDRQEVLDMMESEFGFETKLVRIHDVCAYTPRVA